MSLKQIIISILILLTVEVYAQQDPQFSDYKLNISSFNPALAGFYEGSVMLIHRSQFVGIKGAPEALNLNVNVPINEVMGVGVNVISQSLGVTKERFVTGDYSYSIYTSDQNLLSFGLKAGIHLLDVDYSRLNVYDDTDMSFANNIENKITPRVGVGFLYSTPKWYVGVSVPNFLQNNYNPSIQASTIDSKAHFYLLTGYNTYLSPDILFKPSVLARHVAGAPMAVDVAANFDYREQFRFGLSYRWNAAVSVIAGINVTENIQVGYSYDYLTNDLSKYSSGSHQFYLKYTFLKSNVLRRSCNCSFTEKANSTLNF